MITTKKQGVEALNGIGIHLKDLSAFLEQFKSPLVF